MALTHCFKLEVFYINICCFIIFIWTATKIMLTELSCKAEIAQFNDASFGDENIFRLHVSMNTLNININIKFEDLILSHYRPNLKLLAPS